MPHPDELRYGDGKFRSFDPLGDHRVITAEGKQNQHPSVVEKKNVSITSGMGDRGMKYQKAKQSPRKGRKLHYNLSSEYNPGEDNAVVG
jgi:hypothetical protein